MKIAQKIVDTTTRRETESSTSLKKKSSVEQQLSKIRHLRYLAAHPRIRARLALEVDRRPGGESGTWLYYDNWPQDWKTRLVEFCMAYATDQPLPMADPRPLPVPNSSWCLSYPSPDVGRDVYLAQVAHVLWLEIEQKVPWRLEDWSDHELSYLLSSSVCFAVRRDGDQLLYIVSAGSRTEATENILEDPRTGYRFMAHEPEQGRCLIGATPSETGQRLSGWIHDYLWHNPGEPFSPHQFHREAPMLADRLRRHDVPPMGNVYVTPYGCGSASSLIVDLMRCVNIPVRKVTNIIVNFDGAEDHHIGLAFDWQGGAGTGRYLLHTDDLYDHHRFGDPCPVPKGADRGLALWNHVWLDPTRFGQFFSYDPREGIFGKATSSQFVKHMEMTKWLMSTAAMVKCARAWTREEAVAFLQRDNGLTRAEAEACWDAVDASVLAFGDGDRSLGYQRLLDGPDSRHAQWCSRTRKCD